MAASIRQHNGTPTLFLNDQPAFAGLMWGSPPGVEEYALKDSARHFGEAGVHLFTFDMGTGGIPPDWCGPQAGKTEAMYDFSTLERRFQHVLDADPQALFHLRVHLEMPAWWQTLYPEECELLSDGTRQCQSFASEVWRTQANDYLRALAGHFERIGLAERVIAYQTGTGTTGEWVKGPGSMKYPCGDYSQPMKKFFRTWLRRQYHDDEDALRKAWAQPYVTFETAEVPTAEEQNHTACYTFRDPLKEQNVIDYYRCLAERCGDLLIDFCTTVKEATGGKAIAGAFYGYLLELAWNANFFGDGEDVGISTYQRSGHLGLQKVLRSPNVDFLVSPYSYGFRGIGGDGPGMLPSESTRLHGKLYIYEDDTRTHLTLHDHPNYGKTDTLQENIAVLQRNFASILNHGQGIWWLAGGSPASPHIELSQQPAFRPLIERFQKVGTFALDLDRTPSAEVAVLLDDESFYYEWLRNSLDVPAILQQRLWGLAHMGAPSDIYLLDDLLEGGLKPYKLYIFLNAFHLDRTRREKLKHELRQDGRVALWIYAPGYIQDGCAVENMTDLTGMNFIQCEHPWGPMINLLDFDHEITRGLPQDLSWGTNTPLGPVFHLADESVRRLGNVVYSLGRCRAGFGVKEFGDWRSVYSAAPNLPGSVLRGVARYAGAHIYSDAGDVLYATPELLSVHTAGGGRREFSLPEPVEVVYDLLGDRIVAQNTAQIQINLPPASTSLFFTGKQATLAALNC